MNLSRIVITGIGLTAPGASDPGSFRQNLLKGRSGITQFETRYVGAVPAGVCQFDELKYQKRQNLRRGTRAGSIAIYCANEALRDAALSIAAIGPSRAGIYLGVTEHGNVETENEIASFHQYNNDLKCWSHFYNPRTVANNPAGEVSLNLGITGPHYTIGAACAAGNLGLIQGLQMLQLGIVDVALAGGISESIHNFGIFAGFKSQGALASHADPTKASRPLDRDRNGIVISEGGCVCTLERLESARARNARIYGEIAGYAVNSDATDMVLPNPERQAECMNLALANAKLDASEIDIISTHATGTKAGDAQECQAVRNVFSASKRVHVNNTKCFIGHAMGAAGTLELAGNLPSFADGFVHPTINVDNLDPECEVPNLTRSGAVRRERIDHILNNSSGMLGINSTVIVKRFGD